MTEYYHEADKVLTKQANGPKLLSAQRLRLVGGGRREPEMSGSCQIEGPNVSPMSGGRAGMSVACQPER